MIYTRTNVYAHGGTFDDPTLLWYARGVAELKRRKLADPTSWRFFGAIHGIDPRLWKAYGYLSDTDEMPSKDQVDLYWNQCQHGTWYFLPWHRGYLLALEAAIRDAIVRLDGPQDWALPYWNYFAEGDARLPPAFATPDWPDGKGDNPLFVPQRWGPNDDGDVYVPLDQVDLKALTDPDFTGVASGGDPGFGGVDTGFSHRGRVHGRLETQPHDWVHVLVGGSDPANPTLPGLMSYPPTAGLDPIFWLHHANIDRLWEVWIRGPVSRGNPREKRWIDGPSSIGERAFVQPWAPSGDPWSYTPGQMADLEALDYTYDDLSPESVSPALALRLDRLRAPAFEGGAASVDEDKRDVEMVGASDAPLRIAGRREVRAPVRMEGGAARRLKANLDAAFAEGTDAALSPERVFLNLENVRGLLDAVAFRVYVNVPEGDDPADHPERLAGNIGLFGVRQATEADDHGGAGLTFVLEITDIVAALRLDGDDIEVRIVPVKDVPEEAQISIGRVSVFRQGS